MEYIVIKASPIACISHLEKLSRAQDIFYDKSTKKKTTEKKAPRPKWSEHHYLCDHWSGLFSGYSVPEDLTMN